jgi:hypothetical protein
MSRSHRDDFRVSPEEALTVKCPKCLKPVGDPCVYVPPRLHMNYDRSLTYLDALKRSGTPTKVPHLERNSAARDKRKTNYVRRPGRAGIRPRPERLYILQAQRQAELDDYLALRNWLKQHADLFLLNDSVLP